MHALSLDQVNEHDLDALRTLIDQKRNRL
jgi:hypothetical protein